MGLWVNAAGCTNACRHCYVHGRPPYGSIYALDELRRIVAEWGPVCILYEPSVHPEFPEIMDPRITGIEAMGFLPTNGFGLAARGDCVSVFTRLREFGFHSLSVTLHGLEANHQRFVGGRPGAFEAILAACRKARAAGFGLNWNVFIDRRNLDDMPALLELADREFGVVPNVGIPAHQVGKRSHRYEALRPGRPEVAAFAARCAGLKWKGTLRDQPLDELTEAAWLEAWKRAPDAEDFRDRTGWPLKASVKGVTLQLDARRRVYFAPQYGEWMPVGALAEGREAILARLPSLAPLPYSEMGPGEARLPEADAQLLHPDGGSVRAKAISAALFANAGRTVSPWPPPGAGII